MGKPDCETSATPSHSPRDTGTQLSRYIPEIFRSRSSKVTPSTQASSASRAASRSPSKTAHTPRLEPSTPAAESLSLDDLKAITADIKDTLSAAISDVCLGMQAMTSRLEDVEETTDRHDTAIDEAQQTLDATLLPIKRSSQTPRRFGEQRVQT